MVSLPLPRSFFFFKSSGTINFSMFRADSLSEPFQKGINSQLNLPVHYLEEPSDIQYILYICFQLFWQ